LATAQASGTTEGWIQQADVIRCYRKVKLDMEERARNVKDMSVSEAEKEAFQNEYNVLRKDFNQFISQFSHEIEMANGTPINFCDLSKAQLEHFLDLYSKYESGFLEHYEQITGTHPKPLMEAEFASNIKECDPKSGIVRPETYRAQYEPDLVVSTWGRL
jgi:hypothetical protein